MSQARRKGGNDDVSIWIAGIESDPTSTIIGIGGASSQRGNSLATFDQYRPMWALFSGFGSLKATPHATSITGGRSNRTGTRSFGICLLVGRPEHTLRPLVMPAAQPVPTPYERKDRSRRV